MDCHAYARNDDTKELKNFNNNAAFPKNAEKHNNNVALAHCVEISERRKISKEHKGFTLCPFGKNRLVIRV